MTHRPCPQCRTVNLVANRSCARCRTPFYRQTIVYEQDAAPYWVVTAARSAAAERHLGHVGRTVALTAAVVATEAALGYMERRFWPGRPLDGAARPARSNLWSAVAGAAVLLAEQALATRAK